VEAGFFIPYNGLQHLPQSTTPYNTCVQSTIGPKDRSLVVPVKAPGKLYYAIIFAAGFALVMLLSSRYGPAVSGDSVFYLSTAESIAEGRGLVDHHGSPLVAFPPLYSLVLSIPYRLAGIDTFLAGWVLNAALFGGILVLAGLYARRCFPEKPAGVYFVTLAALFSLSLASVSASISSEPLFIFLSIVFFLAFHSFIDKREPRYLWAAALIAGIIIFQRWIGVTLAAAGVMLIFREFREERKQAFRNALLFGLVSAGPAVLWVVGRNYFIYGRLTGERGSLAEFIPNLTDFAVRGLHWFLPLTVIELVGVPLILLVGAAVLLFINRKVDWQRLYARLLRPETLALLLFIAIYIPATAVSALNEDHPYIYDDRYIAPVFIPLLILLFVTIEEALVKSLRSRFGVRVEYVVTGMLALWLVYPINAVRQYVQYTVSNGLVTYNEFNGDTFNESETTAFIRQYRFEEGKIITANYPDVVYLFTGRGAKNAPFDGQEPRPDEERFAVAIEEWALRVGGTEGYLIWFWPNRLKRFYTPEQLEAAFEVTTIFEAEDGGLYYISLLPEEGVRE
jgi:hypothetical protein